MSSAINSISIIIPCFNEAKTLPLILERIAKANANGLEKEIIVIDDGSTDNSREIIKSNPIISKYILSEENIGKGASIQKALEVASGDLVIIQDADLEYSPEDYSSLISPIQKGESNIVYGARKTEHLNRSPLSFTARILFTFLVNILYGSKLTDLNTCYKLFKRETLKKISLDSKRFGFCSEVTIKALLLNEGIIEVEVNYEPREKSQGKKITPLDGVPILFNIFYFKFINRPQVERKCDEA